MKRAQRRKERIKFQERDKVTREVSSRHGKFIREAGIIDEGSEHGGRKRYKVRVSWTKAGFLEREKRIRPIDRCPLGSSTKGREGGRM